MDLTFCKKYFFNLQKCFFFFAKIIYFPYKNNVLIIYCEYIIYIQLFLRGQLKLNKISFFSIVFFMSCGNVGGICKERHWVSMSIFPCTARINKCSIRFHCRSITMWVGKCVDRVLKSTTRSPWTRQIFSNCFHSQAGVIRRNSFSSYPAGDKTKCAALSLYNWKDN